MANEEKATTFPVLGVDVSKARLDAALMRGEDEFTVAAFDNSSKGCRAATKALKREADKIAAQILAKLCTKARQLPQMACRKLPHFSTAPGQKWLDSK